MGLTGEDRRASSSALLGSGNPFIEITDTANETVPADAAQADRTPSPNEDAFSWKHKLHKNRVNETQYADTEVEELMAMLRETESLEEQGDILQYLVNINY